MAFPKPLDQAPAGKKLSFTYTPFSNVDNLYVARMREVLSRYGEVKQFQGVKQSILDVLRWNRRRYDVAFFNWMENDILHPRTHRISWLRVAKVFLKTLATGFISRRTVFFRHNLYPHATLKSQEHLAQRILARYERLFDVVYVHSGAHLDNGRIYCPHPLYPHAAPEPSGGEADGLPASLKRPLPDEFFVAFGRIARYKQILELAKAFPADRNLLIIGSISDMAYSRELEAIDRPNIFYRPGLLSEADAQATILKSRAVVISHAGDNTIVSGSFFYAVSLPVPVIAVETPFLKWAAPRVGGELMALAPDLPGLAQAAHRFRTLPDLAHLQPRIQQEFGDDAIAAALSVAVQGL
ncbi:MAG: hypothetical protein JWQ88_1490 [Rhodoferax sp.]|nr:hypothetical protein [Rhodoferax sp.]